ncbi:MAG: hypothetical protein ACE5O2_09135 [Armatimonadota bacterium]
MLALAVAVEARNAERLATFADMFADYDHDVSALFAEMRDQELQHQQTLAAEYRRRYGHRPCAVDEEDVAEVVEAVDIDDGEAFVFDSLTRRRVLEAILNAEEDARPLYLEARSGTDDEGLRELYGRLAAFEDEHVHAVLQRIRALSREEAR